jgi:methyltransferase (TIGR00027 family)
MEPLIRDVSDTARWMAVYRARETDRPDAVFRDPLARALAGERGEQIAKAISFGEDHAWSFIARTYLVDRAIARVVAPGAAGADLVLNLAAGLDTRPYRMELPASLRWVEVDLPEILDYKEEVLADAKPVCKVERVRLDLSNHDARRGLFNRLGREATHVAVVSEGLVIYLMADEVCALGRDLAAPPSFRHWIVDIVSPGLLEMIKKGTGNLMQQAGAPFLFAPPEGPAFFEACGWKPVEVRSILKAARKIGRLPLLLKMIAMLPEPSGPQGSRPWSAVCLLQNRVIG